MSPFLNIYQRLLPLLPEGGLRDGRGLRSLWLDLLALLIVMAAFAFVVWSIAQVASPITQLQQSPVDLDPHHLPEYALRTTLRMLAAVVFSFFFTLAYATLAAKSRRAEQVLVPLLDVLQSVPVLGYISFTVTGFVSLFPHSMLGVELAAIFAIFTSQVWNMIFSLYQSLRGLPHDLVEAAYVFRLSSWQKFWRIELPYALPGLIWNMMISMSGGWFFVVASEAITVGNRQIMLPGIGSYIFLAIQHQNLVAIGWAIFAMMVVIVLYDQLLFRPLVAWADKFRYEMTASQNTPSSWVLTLFRSSRLAGAFFSGVQRMGRVVLHVAPTSAKRPLPWGRASFIHARWVDKAWYALLSVLGLVAFWHVFMFLYTGITSHDLWYAVELAGATMLRVFVLIVLASVIWVPLGVAIGLQPRLARIINPIALFLAAFPANLLFPPAVMLIARYGLEPNIWLSPLMILGTQWYIVFNVIAGTAAFPNDLREAAQNFKVGSLLWWRKVMLPGVFPYFVTGCITASGGAWNASIVAEAVQWGDRHYSAFGLGAYIAEMTRAGDFPHIALGIGMMSLCVVLTNRLLWRPLYDLANRKYRLD